MANNNPISYNDFFDFNDNSEIQQVIADMRMLYKTWKEFKEEVIKPVNFSFNKDIGDLSTQIKAVADSTASLAVTNEKSQAALMANLLAMQKLKDENEALKKSQQGSKAVADAMEESVNGLTQKLKEQVVAYRAMKKGVDDLKMKTLASEIQVTRYEITELNNATKGTTSVFQAAKGSYAALDAETKKLVKDLQQMDNGLDANNMSAKALKEQIAANTIQLKAFDAQIGHNFRNVGNYKSAFDGLGMSVQQILREAPSAAVSLNTFFLAISNNLPIFFDEVQKINKVQKEALEVAKAAAVVAKEQAIAQALATGATEKAAAAEGVLAEKTVIANAATAAGPGLLSRLSSSIFSVNTLLTVAVLALTLFGGKLVDFFSSLFKGNKAINDLKENLNNLNEVMANANKDAGSQITSLNALYKSATDANIPMADRLKYVKELKKEFPDFFAGIKDETILNGKSKLQYDELVKSILATARAKASLTKISDIAAKQLDLEFEAQKINNATTNEKNNAKDIKLGDNFGGGSTFTRAQQQVAAENRRKAALADVDAKKSALQRQADFLVKYVGGEKKLADGIVAQQKDTSEAEAKKAKAEADRAERALERAIKKQDDMIKASAKLQLSLAEQDFSRSNKTPEDEEAYENKKLKILENSYGLRLKLYKKDSKDYTEILAEKQKAENDNAEKITQIRDKGIVSRTNIALKEVQATYDKTNKEWNAEVEFEAKRIEIIDNGFNERLKLYNKDSEEYKKLLEDKNLSDAESAARTLAIEKARREAEKGALDSGKDLFNTQYTGTVKLNVAKGNITKDQGDKAIHMARIADLQEEIDKKQEQLDSSKKGDQDYYNYLKELNNLKKSLVDENSSYEISAAEKVTERKKELAQAIFDFSVETAGAIFDVGKTFNQASQDDLEAQKQRELDLAGNNANARIAVEANFQKKLLALKRKQAIFDKLQAIFDIGIHTAVAVMKAYRESPLTFGMPFSGIAIAAGVVETAAVLAKPLPSYYKGRNGGPAEFANVNEEGPELLEKNGNFRFANKGKKGITFLEAGEKVRTFKETQQILSDTYLGEDADAFINSMFKGNQDIYKYQQNKEEKLAAAIIKSKISENNLGRIFDSAINKLPGTVWSVDEKGWRKFQTTVSSKIENMNERNKLMGNG